VPQKYAIPVMQKSPISTNTKIMKSLSMWLFEPHQFAAYLHMKMLHFSKYHQNEKSLNYTTHTLENLSHHVQDKRYGKEKELSRMVKVYALHWTTRKYTMVQANTICGRNPINNTVK
jgi:hypothetical protein